MTEQRAFAALRAVIAREMVSALRRRSDTLTPLVFFAMVTSLFPVAIGPEPNMLRAVAPGVIWVAALLSALLSLDHLFLADYRDGTLEQLLLAPLPLTLIVAAKTASHWLLTGVPLILMAPVIALQFGLPAESILTLILSLLLGTPVLSLIGATGAALTLGLRRGGILIALLVLPLTVPLLVFGAGAVEAKLAGLATAAHLSLLGALLILAALFAPWATAAALRIALES